MYEDLIIKELKDIKEVLLCKINKTIIGQIPNQYITSQSRNFDDIDSITFKIPKNYRDVHSKKLREYYLYDEIKNERFISIDGEFFIIKEISTDELTEVKTVTAYGSEKKMEKINFVMKDKTLTLLDSNEEDGIYSFGDMLYKDTGWKLGFIDYSVRYMDNGEPKARVQEDTNEPYYSFITETIKEQFCCIPIFDRKNKTLNLYDIDSFGDELKFVISKDTFINSLETTSNSNDIITRLTLEGNEEKCDISDIIPTGFNYIENYSYFIETEEMSKELIKALRAFEIQATKYTQEWDILVAKKNSLEKDLSTYNANEKIASSMLEQLQGILQSYKDSETDEIKYDTTELESRVIVQRDDLMAISSVIEKAEKELKNIKDEIERVNLQCRRETVTDAKGKKIFTQELLDELKEFTYYDTFSDDSFVDAQELYKTGIYKLENMCKPTFEYNMDIIDFTKRIISSKVRKMQKPTLGLGDVIALYNRKKDTEEYVYFVGWEKDYESDSLNITLSNKKTNQDVTKTISDLLRDTKNNHKLITSSRYFWNNEKYNRINDDFNMNTQLNLTYQIPTMQRVYNIESLTLSETELRLGVGETYSLLVKILPEEANQTVIWSSSDESICKVQNGLIISTGEMGSCTINCISEDGSKVAICAVTVSEYAGQERVPVTEIRIDNNTSTLGIKNAFYIVANILPTNATNKGVTYISSDTGVAKVNEEGLVSGVAIGKCSILVISNDNPKIQASYDIEVVNMYSSNINTDINGSLFIGDERFANMLAHGFLDNMIVDAQIGATATYFYTDDTKNRLSLYPSDVTSIVVLLGVNDIYGSGEVNIKKLLSALRNKYPVREIFVIKELPVSVNKNGYESINSQINSYNVSLSSYCSSIDATFIDCSISLLSDGKLNGVYEGDGNNLNLTGLKLLFNSIQAKMVEKLKQKIEDSNNDSNDNINSNVLSVYRQKITDRAEDIAKLCQNGKAWYSQLYRTYDYNKKQVIQSSTEKINVWDSSKGSWVSKTYTQPGKGKYGFDCSSLVGCCYQNAGFNEFKGLSCSGGTLQKMLKKYNAKAWTFKEKGYEGAKPGDIVMMACKSVDTKTNLFTVATHHTAIYMGDKYVVEAIGYQKGIQKRVRTPDNTWIFFRIENLTDSDKNVSNSNNDTQLGNGAEEYKNCFNEKGIINGYNYIYRLANAKCTAYSNSSSACNIPLSLGATCGGMNMPYGTKIYIPKLDGKKIVDKNGKSKTCTGVFTVNDCGVGATDFDLYMSTYSDSDAEKVLGDITRSDVYVLSWGSGYGTAWSYTTSYEWAYNRGTLSAYKSAFKNYITYGGTLINLLKFRTDDKNIRSSKYWTILNG